MLQHFGKSAFISVLLLMLGATPIAGQTDEDSPLAEAIHRFETFLFNSDKNALDNFVETQVSPEFIESIGTDELRSFLTMLRNDVTDLRGINVQVTGPYSFDMIVTAGDDSSNIIISCEFESQAPYRFTSIGATKTEGRRSEPLDDRELTQKLTEYMQKLADKDRFSGAVLVAHNGKILYREAFGLANRRYSVPNNVETKFNLGSMNKMFTGTAICRLVQEGKLKFTDTVGTYLPDYPNKKVRNEVTIHQLLTHTSGLRSYWIHDVGEGWQKVRTVAALLDAFAEDTLLFEPGERFQYSNSGPIVLGRIIEVITGESYYDYIKENVYDVADMPNSGCFAMDIPVPNLAYGYTNFDYEGNIDLDIVRNNLYLHSVMGGPAGGGFSTVDDMYHFMRALQDNKLLSPAYTDTLTTGKVTMMGSLLYAYLFGDEHVDGHRKTGHNGGAPGISADCWLYPDMNYIYVILSNTDNGTAPVRTFIEQMIASNPPSDPEAAKFAKAAKEERPKYRIGVGLQPGPEHLQVGFVLPDGPADKAGLQPGDQILLINGEPIADDPLEQLNKVLSSPDAVGLSVRRGEDTLSIELTPEPAP